jgi:hypothetical protein
VVRRVLLLFAVLLQTPLPNARRNQHNKPPATGQGSNQQAQGARDHFQANCPISFGACERDTACSTRLAGVLTQPGWRPPQHWTDADADSPFALLVECVAGRLEDISVAELATAQCPYPAPPPRRARPVLGGADVVAYHDAQNDWRRKRPMPAAESERFSFSMTTYDYTTDPPTELGPWEFWFSSEANRARFEADPWKYAPRWGGFCGHGMVHESPEKGWPYDKTHLGPPAGPRDAWAVDTDGALIMNYLPEIRSSFFRNPEQTAKFRRDADSRWIEWWGRLRAGSFNTHCLAQLCPRHCRGKRGCHSCDCHDYSQQYGSNVTQAVLREEL